MSPTKQQGEEIRYIFLENNQQDLKKQTYSTVDQAESNVDVHSIKCHRGAVTFVSLVSNILHVNFAVGQLCMMNLGSHP